MSFEFMFKGFIVVGKSHNSGEVIPDDHSIGTSFHHEVHSINPWLLLLPFIILICITLLQSSPYSFLIIS